MSWRRTKQIPSTTMSSLTAEQVDAVQNEVAVKAMDKFAALVENKNIRSVHSRLKEKIEHIAELIKSIEKERLPSFGAGETIEAQVLQADALLTKQYTDVGEY